MYETIFSGWKPAWSHSTNTCGLRWDITTKLVAYTMYTAPWSQCAVKVVWRAFQIESDLSVDGGLVLHVSARSLVMIIIIITGEARVAYLLPSIVFHSYSHWFDAGIDSKYKGFSWDNSNKRSSYITVLNNVIFAQQHHFDTNAAIWGSGI